jgi:hypothetical protein
VEISKLFSATWAALTGRLIKEKGRKPGIPNCFSKAFMRVPRKEKNQESSQSRGSLKERVIQCDLYLRAPLQISTGNAQETLAHKKPRVFIPGF